MLRRSETSHFVPDAYVFPGGTVDQSDLSPEALSRAYGLDEAKIAREFRAVDSSLLPVSIEPLAAGEAAGLLLAGARELFEEAGILLACNAEGAPAPFTQMRERLERGRADLCAGDMSFSALLGELGLYADVRGLTLFSQWITPAILPRRYNTHFFLALASDRQIAVADARETHDDLWIAPRDALDRHAKGELHLVYPTIKHLERLAEFGDARRLLEFARTKPIYRVMPAPVPDGFLLPPELEYAW